MQQEGRQREGERGGEEERRGREAETVYPSIAVMRGELLWLTFCCSSLCV